MPITTHHFEYCGNKVSVYWYEDRYRYTVETKRGIEYREMNDKFNLIYTKEDLELAIKVDISVYPYEDNQYKAKCIRCSKPFGAPRKKYNLAPICNRCFAAMDDIYGSGTVFYEINTDGSKGSVIKETQ